MKIIKHFDSWVNAFTGLGRGGRDKVTQARILRDPVIDDESLEAYYQNDDMAARVVEMLPNESMRPGYRVDIKDKNDSPDTDASEAVMDRLLELEADRKLLHAQYWGRLFGGGAVYVMVEDGSTDQAEPMAMDKIKAIGGLKVLDRRELIVRSYYNDPTNPKFGEPEIFQLQLLSNATATFRPSNMLIHETRLIRFFGQTQTKRQELERAGWSHSVLARVESVLRSFHIAWQSLTHLTQDSAQAVFKLKGLIDAIADGDKDAVLQRLTLIDMSRSVAQAVVLDADEEEFERHAHNLSGYGEVMDRFAIRLAASLGIPVTVLMGQSPAGLNATGESDLRLFYGMVSVYREQVLRPALVRLITIILHEKEGATKGKEPNTWTIEFPPFMEMSQRETAELRKLVADTDAAYIQSQVLTPEEVALSRFPATGWSINTSVDLGLREEAMDAGLALPSTIPDPTTPSPATPTDPNAPKRDDEGTNPGTPSAKAIATKPGEDTLDPKLTLNGAQVTAMIAIVGAVARKEIPRETGLQMITAAFPLDTAQAESILGPVGSTFFVETSAPAPAQAKAEPTPAAAQAPDKKPKPGFDEEQNKKKK